MLLAAIAGGLIVGAIVWTYFHKVTRKRLGGDPLAEAGFYFAYGQKKRAIEILEQAQIADPDRAEIATRLAILKGASRGSGLNN
jgi:hypothetical protein